MGRVERPREVADPAPVAVADPRHVHAEDAAVLRDGAVARKVLGWPKICKLAHASL